MSRQEYKMSEGTYLKAISMKACGYHVSLYKNTFDKKKEKMKFSRRYFNWNPVPVSLHPPPSPLSF